MKKRVGNLDARLYVCINITTIEMNTTETADHDHKISRPFYFVQKSKSRLTIEYIFLTIAIVAFIAASFMAASQYAVISH